MRSERKMSSICILSECLFRVIYINSMPGKTVNNFLLEGKIAIFVPKFHDYGKEEGIGYLQYVA